MHNAELCLVRSVLEAESFGEAAFLNISPDYFRDGNLKRAWKYLLEFWSSYGKIPAYETVFEQFPELTQDILATSAPEPPEFYARRIIEAHTKVFLAEELKKAAPLLQHDLHTAIESLRNAVASASLSTDGVNVLDLDLSAHARFADYNRGVQSGIKFGWPTLDALTGGAQPGQLIGFIARAGQGKTWSLIYNIYNAWRAGYSVLTVGTELPAVDMFKRVDAMHLGTNYSNFRKQLLSEEELQRYRQFLFELDQKDARRLRVVDSGFGLTPSALNVLIQRYEPDIVFIDGVYLLESDAGYTKGQDWQKIRYLANELKHTVARRNNIPVVFNTQFSRSVGTAVGKSKKVEGGVEDIGYGDEFGKASDLLVSIFRTEEDAYDRLSTMKIIKGREVEEGRSWKILFDFSRTNFAELATTGMEVTEPPSTEVAQIEDW